MKLSRLLLVLSALGASLAAQSTPAFPGAEGFGANAIGGRGGAVIAVTNLDDYLPDKDHPIPGSLRAAIEAKGPRTIVFRVGGIIDLKAHIEITEPFLTIAGQTAPGDGICLRNYSVTIKNTHDIVIRYLRVRPGDSKGIELDAMCTGTGCKNVIIDHCSVSWSNDETLSVSGAGQDAITVQWCIISESMNQSSHHKGAHGYGSLLRTDGHVTFHHNLYAHHRTRCPRPGTYGNEPGLLLDFRNNAIYDWVAPAGYTAEDSARIDYVANFLRQGPSTKDRTHAFSIGGPKTSMFVVDNVLEGVDAAKNNWVLIDKASEGNKLPAALPAAPVTTTSAAEAFESVLRNAGATLPQRDAVDARVVQEVRDGGGRVIDSQKDVGGWPDYHTATAPQDTDGDGIPDSWETHHGFNPKDAADGIKIAGSAGYTNLEVFLNEVPAGK